MLTNWLTYSGKLVEDPLAWVRENSTEGQAVHIGTDSLQTGKFSQFVSVVVILKATFPKGGRIIYQREILPKLSSLRERLFKETWKSVDLGLKLTSIVLGDLTIHIDANDDPRYKSAKFVEELVGLVVGQGFKYLIKPDSYAASHAADHVVRHKGKLPKEVNKYMAQYRRENVG